MSCLRNIGLLFQSFMLRQSTVLTHAHYFPCSFVFTCLYTYSLFDPSSQVYRACVYWTLCSVYCFFLVEVLFARCTLASPTQCISSTALVLLGSLFGSCQLPFTLLFVRLISRKNVIVPATSFLFVENKK